MEIDIEHSRQVRDGEWHIFEHYKNTAGERTRVLDSFGVLVAETQTEERAVQIVADHAAVRRLAEALRACQTYVEHHTPEQRGIYRSLLDVIDTALATVADGGRETENGHTCIDINNALTGVPCNACRLERS